MVFGTLAIDLLSLNLALENKNLSALIMKTIHAEIKFLKKQIDLLENEVWNVPIQV